MIYIFHMPLFFFLSGYVHNNGVSMGGFALKKAKSLLYPYYVIGTIYILHNTLLDVLMRKFEWGVWKRVAAFLYGNYIWDNNASYIGTLWFLAALFCVESIFELLRRYSAKSAKLDRTLFFMIIGTVIVGCVIARLINASRVLTAYNSGYRLPYCIDIALVAVFFHYIGYELRRNSELLSKSIGNKAVLAIILGFVGVLLG